jgi:hypothetical protein
VLASINSPSGAKETTMAERPKPADARKPEHPIEAIFVRRWSRRAMAGAPLAADTAPGLTAS